MKCVPHSDVRLRIPRSIPSGQIYKLLTEEEMAVITAETRDVVQLLSG
jgi:hypothetical protein